MTINVYKVEKDVPIPEPKKRSGVVPLSSLGVGESVEFPANLRRNVASSASRIKRKEGKDFTIRIVDEENCRVWRTK